MSNKNRAQRRGYSAGGYVNAGTEIMGALGGFFPGIGGIDSGPVGNRTALIERMLVRHFMKIALSRFKWTGLPDTVSERWLSLTLMSQALAVFFKDPDNGQFFATTGTPSGNYNMVGDPTEFNAIAANGLKSWRLDVEHCVPIWANELRWPDLDYITNYAKTIAETDRTIQINLKNSRQPKVLAMPQNAILSVQSFNEQLEAGNSSIEVTDQFGEGIKDMIQVLDMSIHQDLVLNTSLMRGRLVYELMDMLGINHAPNADKKERLVSAEVDSNNDVVSIIRRTNLDEMQKACVKINELWPEIAQLPRNVASRESELDDENQKERPGVWVEYVTDDPDLMDDGENNDSNENGEKNTNAEKGEGD